MSIYIYSSFVTYQSELSNSFDFCFSDVIIDTKKRMSSNLTHVEYDPATKLSTQPVRGILKTGKSSEDVAAAASDCPTTGMTRSESKR